MKRIITGILAHVDAGKTTLSEAMLYKSGVIRSMGRVDHKNAYLDTDPQERARGITIYSKQAGLEYRGTLMTLLDTPGHVDFSSETERSIAAMDYAILVISANEGVQGHTRTLWKLLDRYSVPVFIFVNKMDQPGADKGNVMRALNDNFRDGGIIDFSNTKIEEENITAQDEILEQIALNDEQMLNEYLERGSIRADRVKELIYKRIIFPVYFGSALKLTGVEDFMDGFVNFTKKITYPNEFGAYVYKVSRDEQGNVLTHVKITGGSLKVKSVLEVGDTAEKINQIRVYCGPKYELASEAKAGEVCALAGLSKAVAGQGFGIQEWGMEPYLVPVLTFKMTILSGEDPAAIIHKIKQLEQEEPGLHIRWNKELREINIQLMGEVQTQILKELIKQRYNIDVEFNQGSIIYRETIGNTVEGVGHFEPLRHYAEVHLRLEPAKKGAGVVVDADCKEDMLARNWQRLILTHLREKEHKGVLTGAPVTDIKITLTGGRAHIKHTEGGDFRQAAYRAVRQGLMGADSILLEPFYDFELKLPAENVGRAMSDIELMHGSVRLDENNGSEALLSGYAPVACIRDYHLQIVSYTKGRGHIQLAFHGYEPCHNADEVIQAKRYDPKTDIRNTPDSVFCAHGVGFVVPWNQVKSYMHVALENMECDTKKSAAVDDSLGKTDGIRTGAYTGSYEDDKELEEIFNRTFGKRGQEKRNLFRKKTEDIPQTRRVSVHREIEQPAHSCLLVDGYNIIFAWEELNELSRDNIEAARTKLMDILCNYQGYTRCNLILVFDAYKVSGHPCESVEYNNITVVYTAHAQTADSYIEKFAHEMAGKYRITVATSDRLEQMIILGEGCMRLSARDFKNEIERVDEAIREKLEKI